MRCAPSVIYPVGRSAFLGRLLLALGLGSFFLLLLWGWHASGFGHWTWWALALAWFLWVGLAWTTWQRIPQEATLEWDGLAPSVQDGKTPGRWIWCLGNPEQGTSLASIQVVADWQSGMLLRLTPSAGRPTWAWVGQVGTDARWPEFRRAIVFSAGA